MQIAPQPAPAPPAAPSRPGQVRARFAAVALVVALVAGCDAGVPASTPPVTPGTSAVPRDVNIVARDYAYVPIVVDLVPGETVRLHVINGGLETHEAILGDLASQLAWESAEGATVGHAPGPTPLVPDPPGFDGLRVVVGSGQRIDVTWTVPAEAASAAGGGFVGCHIPGHWQKGMVVPVRFVGADGRPLPTQPGSPVATPSGSGG
jgi:uncharacterized cupredoxin-like copper-binding protein